ncbi:hypothetical protein GPALN_016374 [Globodera pallida]|nr:hypothetical protein GPALN_016374 [Globodera pallida]
MYYLSRTFLNASFVLAKRGAARAVASTNAAAGQGINAKKKKYNNKNKKKHIEGRGDSTVVTNDCIKMLVRAGAGGNGLPKYNGIGGSGGFVYARPIEKLSFDAFCDTYSTNEGDVVELMAEDGQHAKQTKLSGQHGKDRVFNVPLGVEIVAENNVLLARCSRLKQLYLVAQGGMGGCANNNFKAEKGEAFSMTVNLKLNPNVGLIGFPNAGKSTLMQALVPNKHVNIAAYPFTTTLPQLCYIKYGDKRRTTAADENDTEDTGGGAVTMEEKAAVCEPSQELSAANREKWEEEEEKHLVGMPFTLSIADLPGIVEGASRNRYNAFDCLKHLEYSDIIVMIVDVHGFQLGPNEPHRSALEMMALLNKEMEQYDRSLIKKPVVLLLNKVDVEDGEQKAQELCEFLLGEGRDGRWPMRLTVSKGKEEGTGHEALLSHPFPLRARDQRKGAPTGQCEDGATENLQGVEAIEEGTLRGGMGGLEQSS